MTTDKPPSAAVLRRRFWAAEKRWRDAVYGVDLARIKAEQRATKASSDFNEARWRLYVTVPCPYCGAEVGDGCAGLRDNYMHTGRWCDALNPTLTSDPELGDAPTSDKPRRETSTASPDLSAVPDAEENERRIRAVLALPQHAYGTGWYSAMQEVRAILEPDANDPDFVACAVCGGHPDHTLHGGYSIHGHRYQPADSDPSDK